MTTAIQQKTITDALNWRYATQVFDTTKPVAEADLHTILESARLSPSSFGLEPWKFIVVENTELRAQLKKVSYEQQKVTDAPVLVVIAYRTDTKEKIASERIERTAKVQNIPTESLAPFKQMIDGAVAMRSAAGDLDAWMRAQSYIPLGIMIETAALLGVDSGPMEGFAPDEVDAILGLKAKNLHATSMLALGYRGKDDAAGRTKVRRDFVDVVEFHR
jgi:nitroreductase